LRLDINKGASKVPDILPGWAIGAIAIVLVAALIALLLSDRTKK
jgi:hypothetical protein